MLLEILLLAIPIIVNAGFFNIKLLKALSLASSSLELIISSLLYFEIPVKGIFFVDNITIYFLLIISSIYLLSVVYSLKYIEAEEIRGIVSEKLYYVLLNFFVASMIFSTIINDYGLMWVGVELTTVASALLITTAQPQGLLDFRHHFLVILAVAERPQKGAVDHYLHPVVPRRLQQDAFIPLSGSLPRASLKG